jgi:hypothetical protein
MAGHVAGGKEGSGFLIFMNYLVSAHVLMFKTNYMVNTNVHVSDQENYRKRRKSLLSIWDGQDYLCVFEY